MSLTLALDDIHVRGYDAFFAGGDDQLLAGQHVSDLAVAVPNLHLEASNRALREQLSYELPPIGRGV